MATNPCLCGFHGSNLRQCRCSPLQIENYLGKISGPLLDRIAIHVAVRPVDIDAWSVVDSAARMSSDAMREMVVRAREMQARRFAEPNGVDCNARITERMFASHCAMEPPAEALFVRAQKSLLVSARAHRPCCSHHRGPGGKRVDRGATRRGGGGVSGEDNEVALHLNRSGVASRSVTCVLAVFAC
jgi:predicted ATPase with chaperone activity